jgi:hypothetical protein
MKRSSTGQNQANCGSLSLKRRSRIRVYEDRPRKRYRGVDLISNAPLSVEAHLMKTPAQRRRNNIDFKRRARRVLKASLDVVQQRLGKSDRRKFLARSVLIYEIRPRADKHGFNLSSDSLRYSPLWYRGSNAVVDAVRFARSCSRSHPVMIRIYDATGNLIETLEYRGDSKEW